MDTYRTDRSKYHYVVKEFPGGQPWIMAEPWEGPDLPLPVRGDWFLGFDLAEGTTLEQAEEIADFMNRHLEGITFTWDGPGASRR
jgi:hypothetical protein